MRVVAAFATALAVSLMMSCAKSTAVTPAEGEATSHASAPLQLPLGQQLGNGEQLMAQFEVALDPSTLTTTVSPVRASQAQPPQGNTYDLDIQNFQNANSFRIVGARLNGDGNFELSFTHAHPFPAPNFANPITGVNRADLGYTGRLLILVDGAPTSFFGGQVQLVDEAVAGPDGYLQTGDLLATTGLGLNTFPYVLLADDGEDNRVNRSNGGTVTGNYVAASGGWQRDNAGASGDAWVGYDYLHGGQTIENAFTLGAGALEGSGFRFTVAVLIKYTDPRGAGGRELRFPPETADVLQFAYRLPYAALDISKITLDAAVEVDDLPAGDTAPISVSIRDWDRTAAESAVSTVGDDPDITHVQSDASGPATVALDCPSLATSPITLTEQAGPSGRPGDELRYDGTVTNSLGAAPAGNVAACIRVIDPEDDDAMAGTYRYGVDPVTVLPDAARALDVVTYQIVPIRVRSNALPPVVNAVMPTGNVGSVGASVTFSATVANMPTGWSWNFGAGATPGTSTEASPMVTLGAAGVYTGSLVASNGAGDSPLFQFAYTVEPIAPSFTTHIITSEGMSGTSVDAVLYNGKPVISYYTAGTLDLNIALARAASPTMASDWDVYAIDTANDVGKDTSLVIHNNRLAISYYDETNGDLLLAQATADAPLSASDWSISPIDQILDIGDESALVSLSSGKLAVAYHSEAGGALKFALATVATPTGPSDWTTMVLDVMNNAGGDKCMLEFNGHLAMAYEIIATDDIKFALSNVLEPTTPADWVIDLLDDAGVTGESSAIAAWNDRLTVVWDYDTGDNLRYGRALVEFPTETSDWAIHDADTVGNTGERTSILVHNGRPVVAYFDNSAADLRIARAKIAEPASEADWQLRTVETGSVGRENTSLLVLMDNTFGIAYQLDGNLAFARASAEW